MKNQWLIIFLGHVKVKLSGRGTERFINECVRRGILVWNVRRLGSDVLTFHMKLKDIGKLRSVYRKSECSATFVGRFGFPFWRKRLWKNSGFLLGFLLFLFAIGVFSNMVWGIDIKGAKPETAYLIEKELNRIGVKQGKLQFQMPDVETIQRTLTNNVNAITWVGVELRGTTFHLQVVEKNEPEKEEELPPRNLVARKEAVVQRVFVEEGKPMVMQNEYVQKGQLLVSGAYGKPENPIIVPAKGIVLGETWYKSEVEVPLKTKFQVYTGEFFRKHYIKLGNFKIKVWGFEKNKYKRSKEEAVTYNLRFLRWTMPISYEKVDVREEEEANRDYTEKQAVEVGKEMAKKELKAKLANDAAIINEKILHKQVDNGKLKLSLYFKVIEDIVTAQPISKSDIQGNESNIQGD